MFHRLALGAIRNWTRKVKHLVAARLIHAGSLLPVLGAASCPGVSPGIVLAHPKSVSGRILSVQTGDTDCGQRLCNRDLEAVSE